MNPQQTLILEQRRRANCLNKNMRKMHENDLPLEMRLNLICVDIAWLKEALEAFCLGFTRFRNFPCGTECHKHAVFRL